MGDPAGIGGEIAAAAWRGGGLTRPFFLIGCPAWLAGRVPGLPVAEIAAPAEAPGVWPRALPVLPEPLAAPAPPGAPDPRNAPAVIAAIGRGAELVRADEAAALVTNPINKHALIEGAGFAFPGHTEYLAALDGAPRAVMMLAGPSLRVVPVTVHIPLAAVPGALTAALLLESARITDAALRRDFGLARPRLALAGLNPHAGEEGEMGREEIETIAPAIGRLSAEGLSITGPHPADTLFHAAAREGYDAALCMYHDQALIPVKTLDFDAAVNVTLGLSFVRTSPDHGTAYDIAGTGRARPDSLRAALALAAAMAGRRGR
jgi:4-hydroxythreonine-4-phosphate dehydrogenase